jgi:pSer/pThr/pTyr-binding forkhead associated (FHA) protein
MQVNLVYFRPDGERKDIPLHGSEVLIGRAEDCNLRIPLAAVSRQHCRIIVGDDEVVIEDLGSANGVYVNSERVQRQSLGAGDKVTIGQAAFVVQVDGEPKKVKRPEPVPEAAGEEVAESELLAESGSNAEAGEPLVEVEEVTDSEEAASAKEVEAEDGGDVVLEEEGEKPKKGKGKKGEDGEVAIDLESVEVGNEGAGSSSVEDILLELEAAEEQEGKKKS